MLRLHGTNHSVHCKLISTALYEKGLEFEYIDMDEHAIPEWQAIDPAARRTCLETEQGWLTEPQVMLDYLEDIAPEPALLPTAAFARAEVRQLSRTIEQYIEAPARRCLPIVLSGETLTGTVRDEVAAELDRGLLAVERLARFTPWITGPGFSQADIFWHYGSELARQIVIAVRDRDLLVDLAPARAHREAMSARASVQRTLAERPGAA